MQQPTDFSELMRLAQSPAGQQLLTLLRRSGGSELESAMEQASQGDYTQAKTQLASLLDTPEAQKLLGQLGGLK